MPKIRWLLILGLLWMSACSSPVSDADKGEGTGEGGLALQPVWTGLDKPVGLVIAPGVEDKLYGLEQEGRVLELDRREPTNSLQVTLDLTDRVYSEGSEQGLLGLAFHPNYAENGYLYVNYTSKDETVISRFTVTHDQGDLSSERVMLAYKQPYANHNGGHLAFGPDGHLYIASGDGGAGGDPHNNAQNKDSLLGKILRLDVDAANPEPELYAWGLRNPWRFSFDLETGDLWAADVGQNELEEINLIQSGGNYGWRLKEGTACFNPLDQCDNGKLIDPVWEYPRSEGQSVTGGYVYRGSIASLHGWYTYGDFVTGKIWALRISEGGQAENRLLLESGLPIASFGEDQDRELYVIDYSGTIYHLILQEGHEKP